MTAAILLDMETDRLSGFCTWMMDQVLAISPFSSTRLVEWLLLMRLFIMFHTSLIMFRSGLLVGQSSTWMLHSCSHVLIFFEECAGARCCWKIMSSSSYRCHTDLLWMKQGDSPTLPYTQYGVYINCWFEEDNITHTSCSYTTPHHYGSWELHGPLQTKPDCSAHL